MPQNKFALARYHLIDTLLHRFEYVKTNYITDYYFEKTGYKVSQRTIQKDIDSMKHDPFLGIFAPIEYSLSHKAYYYTDKEYRMSPFFLYTEEIDRVLSLLSTYQQIMDKEHYMKCICILEKMKQHKKNNYLRSFSSII